MTDLLFILIAASFVFISKNKEKSESIPEYLQIMVNSCVIYDHVEPRGVFHRESKVQVSFKFF